jgi:hypothetical protein
MNKEVYHGTIARRVAPFLEGKADLFGIRYPDNPSMSAALTDDFILAKVAAIGAMMYDQVGRPIILKFSIPERELVNEGQVGGNQSIMGFSTTHLVKDPHILSQQYLQNLGITIEDAIRAITAKEVQFYRVPRKYFLDLDFVD